MFLQFLSIEQLHKQSLFMHLVKETRGNMAEGSSRSGSVALLSGINPYMLKMGDLDIAIVPIKLPIDAYIQL